MSAAALKPFYWNPVVATFSITKHFCSLTWKIVPHCSILATVAICKGEKRAEQFQLYLAVPVPLREPGSKP